MKPGPVVAAPTETLAAALARLAQRGDVPGIRWNAEAMYDTGDVILENDGHAFSVGESHIWRGGAAVLEAFALAVLIKVCEAKRWRWQMGRLFLNSPHVWAWVRWADYDTPVNTAKTEVNAEAPTSALALALAIEHALAGALVAAIEARRHETPAPTPYKDTRPFQSCTVCGGDIFGRGERHPCRGGSSCPIDEPDNLESYLREDDD